MTSFLVSLTVGRKYAKVGVRAGGDNASLKVIAPGRS